MDDEDSRLEILQVSTADLLGGAEAVAWNLARAYREAGHGSWLAVGRKVSGERHVLPLSGRPLGGSGGWGRALRALVDPARSLEKLRGHEDFAFPATYRLLQMPPQRPDILHCHNLHGRYFDLRALPWLSGQVPTVLTLHDAWLLSGHCAHSFGCERWETGCGSCPNLRVYPAVRRDATAFNWRRKSEIYRRSRVYVATPCDWLMERVQRSMLGPAIVEARVINNGVDRTVFRPGDQASARAALGIPREAGVLLFSANGIRRNGWKDYQTLRSAVAMVSETEQREVLCVALGEESPSEQLGRAAIRFVPFQSDPSVVARYYQAADIYVHPTRVETMGMAILEALACGVPAVATAVGGVPEQIIEGETGFLTRFGDARAMAEAIGRVLRDESLRRRLGANAAADAARRFDLRRQTEAYLDWFRRIRSSGRGTRS